MGLKLSDKAKSVIKVVAPTVGAALGGPLGGLAGQILGDLVTGGKPTDLEEAILTQSPETLLALKRAEQEFLLKLEELGVEKERIEVADRSSAREMAKVNMKPQMILSGTFIGGYFAIFLAMLTGTVKVSQEEMTMINVLMGVLTAGIPAILSFWFGSTAGSAVKSQLLFQSKPDANET